MTSIREKMVQRIVWLVLDMSDSNLQEHLQVEERNDSSVKSPGLGLDLG